MSASLETLGARPMKRRWDDVELNEYWSLSHDEFELLTNRTERGRLGFAVLLKFFEVDGSVVVRATPPPCLSV